VEFLSEYGLFFAKVITVVIAIIIVIAAMAAQAMKNKSIGSVHGHIDVKNINDLFKDFEHQMKEVVLSHDDYKAEQKEEKKALKEEKKKKKGKPAAMEKPRLFVLNFNGDVKASELELLRQEITAILTIANKEDEVMINLESPGGMVHTYGLAASQLKRIRSAGIKLTVCVDKVAASGGYMMACVADRIIAAPFAVVGSIGVLAQIPNFNRALKKFDVDYEIMTAGEYKAPVSMFGEITEKGRSKLKDELEETHELFKAFITEHRPQVPIDQVATGEVWYGKRAMDHQLVDEILTSDDFLMQHRNDRRIFEVTFVEKKSLQEKLGMAFHQGFASSINTFFNREQEVVVNKNIQ
jgi:serine protease SohB